MEKKTEHNVTEPKRKRKSPSVPRSDLQIEASNVNWSKYYMLHSLSLHSITGWNLPATPNLFEAVRRYNEAVINVRAELDIAYKLYKEQVLIRRRGWRSDTAAKKQKLTKL